MIRRLPGQILCGFLITYLLIALSVWLALLMLNHHAPMRDDALARRTGPAVLQACADAIRASGPDQCLALRSDLAVDDRWRVRVERGQAGATAASSQAGRLTRQAVDHDGRGWTISYAFSPAPPWSSEGEAPAVVVVFGLVGGLVFSIVYGRYINEPVRRLRENVRELSEGRLSARVGEIGGRRDEIAGLGADLDRMAASFEALMSDRDRLLHHVSHELRSPLSRMQMAIALAQKDPERVPALFERVKREIKRLNQIVSELLSLARAESDLHQSQNYFDLHEIVSSLISDAAFEAVERNIRLEFDASNDVEGPAIRGSAELIWRAIDNILRNAIKFSPPNDVIAIRLTADRAKGLYLLVIQDKGPGIAPETLPLVFDPFRKADGRSDGFGLGLSIARRAVEAHGGSIRMESVAGLRVIVTIPFAPSGTQGLSTRAGPSAFFEPVESATALVHYVEHDGTEHHLRARLGRNVMEIAVQNRVSGIVGECGGGCKCATCHVYVDAAFMTAAGEPSSVEQDMLELTPARQSNSRLSCQIVVTEALDGLVVHMPSVQR